MCPLQGSLSTKYRHFLNFQNNGLLHQTPFSITATALTGSQGTAVNACYRTEIVYNY